MSDPGFLERGLLIGGREVAAVDGKTIDVVNPTTGDVFGRVAVASEEDADGGLPRRNAPLIPAYGP